MISLKNIQTEVDASFLYKILANNEENTVIADIFREMSTIEMGHAIAFLEKNNMPVSALPSPSWRAKVLHFLGRIVGYDYILGVLLDTEKSISTSVLKAKQKTNAEYSVSDTAHVAILKNIINSPTGVNASNLARFERRHKTVGGNALRAAVLGGNDGLVSNFSLVMGIAGASSGQKEVLIAGMAGLLAGALSMALGEWISVRSSEELDENQMQLEMDELTANPEGEEKEIALIYISKGVNNDDAKNMAKAIMSDPARAHEFLVKEELGIDSVELKGSAMEAAVSSFVLFAVGAIIPVIPFFFYDGNRGILLSSISSAIGLFLIGAAITLFTGKNVWYSGFRQVIFGLAAAAVTFGIGKIIGISILS